MIEALAKDHEIVDHAGLLDAMDMAAVAYDGARYWSEESEGEDAPDSLHEIEEPASNLAAQLDIDINRHRLVQTLVAGAGEQPMVISEKLEEWLRYLDAIRLAARKGRAREPGRPRGKADLDAAYAVLSGFWQRTFSQQAFTQVWADTADGLQPISRAACFLRDALRIIDPDRPRLAEELRSLMAETVKKIPGERRGRRTVT